MLDLNKTPRCASYLKRMRANLNEPSFNEYWAALCVAESFTEKTLTAFGGINFHTMKGDALLARMEEFLEFRSKKKPKKRKRRP